MEATIFSLLLNFSTVFVAIIGIFSLEVIPEPVQWVGIGVFPVGVLVYFRPQGDLGGTALGHGLAAGDFPGEYPAAAASAGGGKRSSTLLLLTTLIYYSKSIDNLAVLM